MRNLAGLLIALVVVALAWWANAVRERAVQPRVLDTALGPDAVRGVFAANVTSFGWVMVDPAGTRARSPRWSGTTQEVAVEVRLGADGRHLVWLGPTRLSTMAHLVNKPWTIKHRLDRVQAAIGAADPTVRPAPHESFETAARSF